MGRLDKEAIRNLSQEEWRNLDVVEWIAENTPYFYKYHLKPLCDSHHYDLDFQEAQSILLYHATHRVQSAHRRHPDADGQRRVLLLYGTVRNAIDTAITSALYTCYFTDAFVDADTLVNPNGYGDNDNGKWHCGGPGYRTYLESTGADGSFRPTCLHAAEQASLSLTSDDFLHETTELEQRIEDEQELSDRIESLISEEDLVKNPDNRYTVIMHETFRMRAMESLDFKQIAEINGCKPNSSRKLHNRAMSRLWTYADGLKRKRNGTDST